jgi:hypothetical protein
MMAEESDDLPEEISDAMQAAGFAPTLPNLRELIANARAREHEAELRRQQWPLLALIPSSVNAEVARRAADQGLLVAERIGGRWFASVSSVETWLRKTGRWFRSEADERRWRKMLVERRIQ